MKDHRPLSRRQERETRRALFQAISTLHDADECRRFFLDLCTPAELQAMADRWAVVGHLKRGLPYREIHDRTGVSVTTVGRVARCLTDGNGGYEIASQRMDLNKMEQHQRVKVAVQKSGRLTENSLDLFTRCGLRYSRSRERLFCFGENMPVDVMLVRDDDIPHLVRDGVCDLGIAGLNVLEEKCNGAEQNLRRISALDFGHCRLSLAVTEQFDYQGINALAGTRIATSYPKVLGEFLTSNNIDARIVEFSGAVEIAPRLGQADLICDLVSSGETLAANHLREVEVLLESECWLVAAPEERISCERREWVDRLIQRVEGVQQVNGSKYIMLHAPRAELKRITDLLPGSETPTVMPLEGSDDRVAVHAVCRENVFWETLELLKAAGASSMLVLPVEKMLA